MSSAGSKIPAAPSALANRLVRERLAEAFDWHSDFLFKAFIESPSAFDELETAVRTHRKAKEKAGVVNKTDDEDAAYQDGVEAAYLLGFALGARLGGLR